MERECGGSNVEGAKGTVWLVYQVACAGVWEGANG
jgi:hypothetical protein